MKSVMNNFKEFELSVFQQSKIKGGRLCNCKAAAPYSCDAGGYEPGTVGFSNCMEDIYDGCDSVDPSCE